MTVSAVQLRIGTLISEIENRPDASWSHTARGRVETSPRQVRLKSRSMTAAKLIRRSLRRWESDGVFGKQLRILKAVRKQNTHLHQATVKKKRRRTTARQQRSGVR